MINAIHNLNDRTSGLASARFWQQPTPPSAPEINYGGGEDSMKKFRDDQNQPHMLMLMNKRTKLDDLQSMKYDITDMQMTLDYVGGMSGVVGQFMTAPFDNKLSISSPSEHLTDFGKSRLELALELFELSNTTSQGQYGK